MFAPVSCNDKSCNSIVYASNDPRLCSAGHSGQRIVLDTPPINGDLFTIDGLDPSIQNTKSYSTGYTDNSYIGIKGGSITYYYDTQLATPFIPQLFDPKHNVVKESYTDPMGICKPHYIYIPSAQKTEDSENACTAQCPSWLRDSQAHREDMMSKQLAKSLQNNYEIALATSGELCVCNGF